MGRAGLKQFGKCAADRRIPAADTAEAARRPARPAVTEPAGEVSDVAAAAGEATAASEATTAEPSSTAKTTPGSGQRRTRGRARAAVAAGRGICAVGQGAAKTG